MKITRRSTVCMLHIGRCGSTVVGDMLDQHTDLSWRREYYEDYEGPRVPLLALGKLAVHVRKQPTPWVGFELKFLDAQHPRRMGTDLEGAVRGLHRVVGIDKWVVLERRNHLQRMVSHVAAWRSRVYHLRPGEAASDAPVNIPIHEIPVGADFGSLTHWLAHFEEAYSRVRAAVPGESMELEYGRDIAADPAKAHAAVLEFLELPGQPTEVRFAKTRSPRSLQDRIENWDDVVNALNGTSWEWMLAGDA